MNTNELFSSFVHEKSKKYYLMQRWSLLDTKTDEKNFLDLVLTDCTNYWIGNCISFLKFFFAELIFLKKN